MGRKRKPTLLIIEGGRSNRSKSDLASRAKSEVKLGDNEIEPTTSVKSDKVAVKMFNHIAKIYQNNDYVTSADTVIIEQYCLTYSDYKDLVKSRKDFKRDNDKKRGSKKLASYEVSEALGKIDTMINKKNDLLQKLGKNLMLDPLSRISAKPLKPEEKPKSMLSKLGVIG